MSAPVDLTEKKDEGVLKEILREGEGDSSRNGTVFDSSRDRRDEFKFQLGVGQMSQFVQSMSTGESSLLFKFGVLTKQFCLRR